MIYGPYDLVDLSKGLFPYLSQKALKNPLSPSFDEGGGDFVDENIIRRLLTLLQYGACTKSIPGYQTDIIA